MGKKIYFTSLEATLVQNYELVTGVKCRATSVAENGVDIEQLGIGDRRLAYPPGNSLVFIFMNQIFSVFVIT